MKIIFTFFIFISFLWGSKVIEIDLSNQKLYAKENGKTLFSGDVSTGKEGHLTPRGSFRVIEKDRYHISNKYPEPNGGAKMYYMLRLTNSGLAIHKGYLPGYPASHGCIRVGKKTAIKLWRWAKVGTRVKIYGDTSYYLAKYRKKRKKYKKKRKKYYAKRNYKKRKHKRVYARRKRYTKKVHYVRAMSQEYQVVEFYDDY